MATSESIPRSSFSPDDMPLDAARSAFEWLLTGPSPLAVDGRRFTGLPARSVPLDELRGRLLDRRCPQPLRDAAWAHLIGLSREEGGKWTVGCVGLALPAHTRHELAIFDTALAAGLLLAAWRPALARAYLPIVWIVAGGLATTALVDMVHGTTTLAEETGHLIAVVQAALLWGLSRSGEPLRRAALAG